MFGINKMLLLRFQKEEEELSQYTTNFEIKRYLKVICNPVEFFSDPNRKPVLSSNGNADENLETDREYASNVLCNTYRFHRKKDINRLLRIYDYDLIRTTNRLDRLPKAFKTQRNFVPNERSTKNLKLLQEVKPTD